MDDIRFKYYSPVVVGTPAVGRPSFQKNDEKKQDGSSFQDILQKKIDEPQAVIFSKHATQRVADRNIQLSDDSLARLSRGVQMANEKHMNDALILVDNTAFVVNVPSNTVITTKDNEDMQASVFTNINGTVII